MLSLNVFVHLNSQGEKKITAVVNGSGRSAGGGSILEAVCQKILNHSTVVW